jgi:hypothetical protein
VASLASKVVFKAKLHFWINNQKMVYD